MRAPGGLDEEAGEGEGVGRRTGRRVGCRKWQMWTGVRQRGDEQGARLFGDGRDVREGGVRLETKVGQGHDEDIGH